VGGNMQKIHRGIDPDEFLSFFSKMTKVLFGLKLE